MSEKEKKKERPASLMVMMLMGERREEKRREDEMMTGCWGQRFREKRRELQREEKRRERTIDNHRPGTATATTQQTKVNGQTLSSMFYSLTHGPLFSRVSWF